MTPSDARQFAPAVARNREPIFQVLQRILPQQGIVLEIASGTGEHAVYVAPRLSGGYWLPSDPSPEALESIQAWRQAEPSDQVLPPMALDVSQPQWPDRVCEHIAELPSLLQESVQAIVAINLLHISPWQATLGLMAGAGQLLPAGGVLYLYGPYLQQGIQTAPSNEAFDAMLRSRNPEWGLRQLEDVIAIAAQRNLAWRDTIAMPANNCSVIFEKA
ncbi:MAG TPA: DUF938 domain-containing protein [Stenomitos sp.]